MDVQVATLCDAAMDYGGKLCLVGTFDTIVASEFPVVHPACSIALRFSFRKMEEGVRDLRIKIVDEDGVGVVPDVGRRLDVSVPEDSFFISRNFVLNIQQLPFEKPGMYSVDIFLDDEHQTSIPLQVRQGTKLKLKDYQEDS